MHWRRTTFLLLVFSTVLFACTGSLDTPAANPEDLLFEETFDSIPSGQWRTEADESGSTSISEGAMVIEISAPNVLQYTTLVDEQFGDFDLELDASFQSSNPDSTLGIFLRMISPNDFIRFEVTTDGRYMVERFNPDGTWTRYLDDWQFSPAIIAGYGAVNRLRVIAEGQEISFFANDELLFELQDAPVAPGQIGLDAATFGNPGTTAIFDNLTIHKP